MRRRDKIRIVRITAAVLIAAAVVVSAFSISSLADIVSYDEVAAGKGTDAALWTISVPVGSQETNLIACDPFEAAVYTLTHVRTEPAAETTPVVTVIDKENRVKVWGVTENGWARVYCLKDDGTPAFGFIKSDLLNPRDTAAETENGTETVETETDTVEQ